MAIIIGAPDGSEVEFPDGTPDSVIVSAMRKTFGGPNTSTSTAPEEKPGSAFGRGLSRSVDITQQGFGSALEGLGRSTGFSGLEQYGAGVAARNTQELQDAEKNATRRQDVEGVGTGLSYAGEALGESAVPMGIGIGAGALTGAAVGSAFGPLGTLAGIGVGAAGAAVSQIPLFYGWNREDQKEAVKQGIIPEVSEGAAFLTAIPQAALEGIADKLLPGGGKFITKAGAGLFTRLAAGAGTGVVTEVPTEVGQQVLSRLQAGRSLSDDEAMSEYLDAAVGAGVVGGSIGGVGGAFSRSKKAATPETEEEESDETEIPDPFAGLPKNVRAEAERLQQTTGVSAEEAVALAQEEINGLRETNQRPAGNVGDVGPEPSVSPPSGENVDARVADPAARTPGAGLGVPRGPAQQAGNREANVPGSLDEIIAQQPSPAGEALAREFPIIPRNVEPIRDESLEDLQNRQYDLEQQRELTREQENYGGEVLPAPAATEQAAPIEQPAAPLTFDTKTPRKERTAQAVAAVEAVVERDFAGIDVAPEDINQAAQLLVNSNGGDPSMSLARVLESEPAAPKKAKAKAKAKAKVTEEVPFESVTAVTDAPTPALTPEATDLLAKVDAGGVPGFMSNNLRKIAAENGVAITSNMTPKDVVNALRAREAAPKTEVAPETAAPEVVKGAKPTVTEAAPDLFSANANPKGKPYVRAEAAKDAVPPEMTNFPKAPQVQQKPVTKAQTQAEVRDRKKLMAEVNARIKAADEAARKAKAANEKGRIFSGPNARANVDAAFKARGPQGITAARAAEMSDPSYRRLQRAEGETETAAGMFSPLEKLIRVALDSGNKLKTLHHEAIHAMRSMGLFKDSEWAALSKRAKDEWVAKYDIKTKYAGDNLTEEQEIEEAVAEAYADYVANKNQGGKTKTLFDRVRNFLRAVVDAVRGTPEGVFQRIEKGEVGRRERKPATGEAAQAPTYKESPERNAERVQVGTALRKRLDELGLHDVALKVPDWMKVERGEASVSLQREKGPNADSGAETEADKADEEVTEATSEWGADNATATSATEALENAVKGHNADAYEKGLDASFTYMGPKFLSKLLSALPGSTIIKWGSKYIKKHLHEVRSLVDTMVAERANVLRVASKISTKYQKFVNAHGQKALSAVMAKARILGVNPTEFANVTEALKNDAVIKHLEGEIAKTTSPGFLAELNSDLTKRQGQIKEVHALWDELGKQKGGHELYKEVRQYYKDMYRVLRSRWITNAMSQVKGGENEEALKASLKAIEDEVEAPDPNYFHGAPKPKVIDQYFPFKRFGEFSLRIEEDIAAGTPRYYERFDTSAQRDAKLAELAKRMGVPLRTKGGKINPIFKLKIEKEEDSYDAKNVSKTVQRMYETIDQSQVLGGDLDAAKMELKRQLNEILLSNLPARSLGKSQMRAENVEGYSMDFFRVFNTSAMSYANQLPRIQYAPKIRAAIKKASLYAENNYSGEVAEKLQLMINELETRAEEAITPPQRNATVGFLNRVAFLWLLTSGASAATQLTSIPIRVLPALGSRYGFTRASAKLAVFSNFYNSVGMWQKQPDGTEKFVWPSMEHASIIKSNPLRGRFFRALQERGVFNDTSAEAITQTGATPETVKLTGEGVTAGAMAGGRKLFDVMAGAFHSSEMISRQIAAMARVELAYEAKKAAAAKAGVKFDAAKAFDAAVDEAVQGNRDTLGDYSEFERPRIMNADLARFVFQFKNYAVTTTKFFLENLSAAYKNETPGARRQALTELAGVLTMGSMFFGVTGLPLYGVVTAAIDTVLDNFGDDEDKRKRRGRNPLTADDSDQRFRYEFLPRHFGNITVPDITGNPVKLSAIIEAGPISALLDQNWSRRTQFNNLWYQQGLKGDTTAESVKNFVLANLGPGVSLGDSFARAIDDFSNGEITRGMIKMNPAFTKGIFTAYGLKTEGATTAKGEVILGPATFSDYNLVSAILGVQSDRLARLQNEKFLRTGASITQVRERNELLGKYTDLSIRPGATPEAFTRLFNRIKEYKQRYPLPDMDIDMENLENSLATTLQKRRYSAYGSYFTPEQLYYEIQNVMNAAPPRQ